MTRETQLGSGNAMDVDAGAIPVATAYIEAVGRHDLAPLQTLLADDLIATFAGATSDKEGWIAALGRLLTALERNEIDTVFGHEERVCVLYDFVTNTPGGTIRCVEVLAVRDGQIATIELILDRVAFAPVNTALQERARHS